LLNGRRQHVPEDMDQRGGHGYGQYDVPHPFEAQPGLPFAVTLAAVVSKLAANPGFANVLAQRLAVTGAATRKRRKPVPDFIEYAHHPVIDRMGRPHKRKNFNRRRIDTAERHEDTASDAFREETVFHPILMPDVRPAEGVPDHPKQEK